MKTWIVYCHPQLDSFTAAVRDAALSGLRHGGHDVRITDLYDEGFDPVFSADDHANHLVDHLVDRQAGDHIDHGTASAPATLISAHLANLRWCESLVLIYPTWWAGQPAMLKGWIDRVFVNGVAWHLPPGADRLQPLLSNIRAITAITTHGSSKLINAIEGEAGKRTVTRTLRALCNRRCRTRWIALYGIDRSSAANRSAFLRRVTQQLAR